MQEDFGVSFEVAVLPLTAFVLGLAFGPVLSAPVSETYGRRAVYLFFFLPSLLFTLGAGFSQNIGSLLVCRLLAAMFGSGCLAVGPATNSDLWPAYSRAVTAAFILMASFLGPALGPPIGGYVSMKEGWRWTQWTILFIGLPTYLMGIPQKETYKRIILQQRAKRLGLPPPPSPLPPRLLAKMKILLVITIIRPIRMLFTESIVAFLSIYTAFNFAVLFSFFGGFPLVFESPLPELQVYHFNIGESGLVFLGIGLGVVLATVIFVVR